jgi:CheY-like chemotaxis protein
MRPEHSACDDEAMTFRALLVDDDATFVEAAVELLEGQGLDIVGAASSSAEAVRQAKGLEPDVVLIDVELGRESGFALAKQLAGANEVPATNMIMISTHAAEDLLDPVAVSPVLGFLPKQALSAAAIGDFLEDRDHGLGCRHEAFVHSTDEELLAGTAAFVRRGLAADDSVLVVMREKGRALLREELDGDAAEIEFADAVGWYTSTDHAFRTYHRYIHDQVARGARRIRIVAEATPSMTLPGWATYEAGISAALADLPASFVCTYDTRELSPALVEVAASAHPLVRSADGPRPSAAYASPVRS